MRDNKHFAEVIDSSLHGVMAQCWEWNTFPSFGSMVTIESNKKVYYCLVHQIQTGSMDPMRYPFPYKKTEEELLREQPQIFEFLKTTFSCLTIGYRQKGKIYYLTAPEPPKIHAFVGHISKVESQEFFASDKYLHVLFGFANQVFNLDEFINIK